jgi:hypothetical protein
MLLVLLLGGKRLETSGIVVLDRLLPLSMSATAETEHARTEQFDNPESIHRACADPTESLKDGGELPRIVSHASNDAVDFGAEATA